MKTIPFLALACWLIISCNPSPEKKDSGPNAALIGTWSWSKQSYTGKDTSYVWNNLDGQLIFTDKYYSLIYVNRSSPRDTTARGNVLDKLSIEQLREMIRPLVANTGSYKIEGDTILLYREVALWPNAMAPDRQPSKLVMPTKISKDTISWTTADGFEFIWVRKE